ncbi:PH domain-containing protein [Arthrobacter sp. HY1533]|uniref:PH domain-containing protein n=1 Tax=Arthrobacter sp. HY1533 TaxID=2970919 RepID=UPI0022B9F6D4|nr:PH domain-containing protein [Arthrobacter sp. HY1533]
MRNWLLEGEQVELRCRPHARILVWPITAGLLAILAGSAALAKLQPVPYSQWAPDAAPLREPAMVLLVLLLGFFLLLYPVRRVLRWNFTRYILSNRRLMVRGGMLGRTRAEYLLENVQEVQPAQNWRQRMVGSGDLKLHLLGGTERTVAEVPELNRFNGETQKAWSVAFRAAQPAGYSGDDGTSEKELRKLGRDN